MLLGKPIIWILKSAIKSAIDICIGAGIGTALLAIVEYRPTGEFSCSSILNFLEGFLFFFVNGAICLMPAPIVYNFLPKFKRTAYWLITTAWICYCLYGVYVVMKRGYGDGDDRFMLFLAVVNGTITYIWLYLSEKRNFWAWLRN